MLIFRTFFYLGEPGDKDASCCGLDLQGTQPMPQWGNCESLQMVEWVPEEQGLNWFEKVVLGYGKFFDICDFKMGCNFCFVTMIGL